MVNRRKKKPQKNSSNLERVLSRNSLKDVANPFINHLVKTTESNEGYTTKQIQLALRTHYKECLSIKRLFYPDNPIPIEKNYINLSILPGETYQKQLNEHINTREEIRTDNYELSTRLYGHGSGIISLEDIIPRWDKEPSRCLLVLGTAGIGKSTLSDRLCHIWAMENNSYLSQNYEWVFKIPLRNLTTERYPLNGHRIIDVIEQECLAPLFTKEGQFLSKNDKNTLETLLSRETEANKVLLILDGFDEISDYCSSIAEILKTLLNFNQVVLTSRPYNLTGLKQTYGFKEQISYEITGFSPENIPQYIHDFFQNLPISKPNAAQDFQIFLAQNPNLSGVCRIPINLELLCSTWDKQPLMSGNYNVTKIYSEVTRALCHRYLEKRQIQNFNDIDRIKILELCEEQLMFLEHLGYQSAYSGQLFIEGGPTSEYMRHLPGVRDHNNFLVDQKAFGFIRPNNPKGNYDGVSPYYFNHLTFRDYFAARFLAKCLQKDVSNEYTLKHRWPNPNGVSLFSFLEENRFNQGYEFIWWFMTGLLKEEDKLPALKYLLFILIAGVDKSEISRLLLLIRCLDESHNNHRNILPLLLWVYIKEWLVLAFKPFFKLLLLSQDSPLVQRLKISPTIICHTEIQDAICKMIRKATIKELNKIVDLFYRLELILPERISKVILEILFQVDYDAIKAIDDFSLLNRLFYQIGFLCGRKYLSPSVLMGKIENRIVTQEVVMTHCILWYAQAFIKEPNILLSGKVLYDFFSSDEYPLAIRLIAANCLWGPWYEVGVLLLLEQSKGAYTALRLKDRFRWDEVRNVALPATTNSFADFKSLDNMIDYNVIKVFKNAGLYFQQSNYFENAFLKLSEEYINSLSSEIVAVLLTSFSCWVLSLTNQNQEPLLINPTRTLQLFAILLKKKELEQEKELFLELLSQLFSPNNDEMRLDTFIQIRMAIINKLLENFDHIQSESIKKYVALFLSCHVNTISKNRLLPLLGTIIHSDYSDEETIKLARRLADLGKFPFILMADLRFCLQDCSSLLKRLELNEGTNHRSLYLVLNLTPSKSLLEFAIKLLNKTIIVKNLLAVLIWRCLATGKALYFNEDGVCYFEYGKYQTYCIEQNQRTELEEILKQITIQTSEIKLPTISEEVLNRLLPVKRHNNAIGYDEQILPLVQIPSVVINNTFTPAQSNSTTRISKADRVAIKDSSVGLKETNLAIMKEVNINPSGSDKAGYQPSLPLGENKMLEKDTFPITSMSDFLRLRKKVMELEPTSQGNEGALEIITHFQTQLLETFKLSSNPPVSWMSELLLLGFETNDKAVLLEIFNSFLLNLEHTKVVTPTTIQYLAGMLNLMSRFEQLLTPHQVAQVFHFLSEKSSLLGTTHLTQEEFKSHAELLEALLISLHMNGIDLGGHKKAIKKVLKAMEDAFKDDNEGLYKYQLLNQALLRLQNKSPETFCGLDKDAPWLKISLCLGAATLHLVEAAGIGVAGGAATGIGALAGVPALFLSIKDIGKAGILGIKILKNKLDKRAWYYVIRDLKAILMASAFSRTQDRDWGIWGGFCGCHGRNSKH